MPSGKVGFDGKVARKLKGIFSRDFQNDIRHLGRYLYVGLIFIVGGIGMWFAVMLAGVNSFAELQPKLHAALAPLAVLFGGNPVSALPGSPAVLATGQITAMDEFAVSAPHSAKVVSVVAVEGRVVTAGDILVKLNDADAQKEIRNAINLQCFGNLFDRHSILHF